ncbi:MAG: preprotein translocase subunit SecA, partial [Bacteroidetes bacterium]|nr:preprotein translocase subunit SecA [Bacteroidota bacterium]
MGIIDNILGKFLGSKSERDNKEIMPLVEKIKEEYDKLTSLTNDELRDRSEILRQHIRDYFKPLEDEIAELREKAESGEMDINESEELYERIDKLGKEVDEKIEEVLNESIPEAFAIVKETTRRFLENEKLEVTAKQFDRDLAAVKESIEIAGDKAYW